ncbi:MAG TPA: Gfo/Idh/MocA family oxidoreductase [Candidatus Hydrogenedentes bacterium]|nr:Gfo/Idh/MocA family oxidoreductase [Candidatus Hydrogenedentota bacterium]
MKSRGAVNRRKFMLTVVGGVAAAALPVRKARAARVGANDKVRLAVIGNGGMGSRHIEALAVNDNCTLVALCDVAMSRYVKACGKVKELNGKEPEGVQDFRHVLDRKDIDAIFVVTPDHWHPLLTILGCQAGKDVYVEKPVCPTVAEGRAMVQAARRYGRIVQAGTQQRSMPVFQKAIDVVRSGRLGQITMAGAWVGVNGWGVGETPAPVPKGLDWDLWLGPAPWAPFSMDRYGGFMGWWDYARGGQLTNWGVHLMDVVHWGIGQDRPLNVQALGGSFRAAPGSDNYECIEAILEYKNCLVTWEQRHQNRHAGKDYGITFHGTEGALYVDRGAFVVEPAGAGIPEYIGEPEKSWANPPHHNNFFESVRTRKKPIADIEQGFRSTTAVLLAGLALKTGRKLYWDGDAERFINDEDANRYLTRSYRAPWHL